tara:strand:+ start:137 stop:358 length:222 start_codon:yes stop_codon:yes gene_type:complete
MVSCRSFSEIEARRRSRDSQRVQRRESVLAFALVALRVLLVAVILAVLLAVVVVGLEQLLITLVVALVRVRVR